MTALLALLEGAFASGFTGNVAAGSAVVTGVASTLGLVPGFPVAGPGLPEGARILALGAPGSGPGAGGTVTLSDPPTPGSAAAFATGLATSGRRVIPWSQLKGRQPALFLVDPEETYPDIKAEGLPAVVSLQPEVRLYAEHAAVDDDGDSAAAAPASMLNAMLGAVEAVLQPATPGQRQTLGGLVYAVRIAGRAKKHPGDIGSQAIAILPLKIIVPTF